MKRLRKWEDRERYCRSEERAEGEEDGGGEGGENK